MHEAQVYDVGVIGGGLAGLSLAIQCANRGYKVILYEKENYPQHKVCGEYISNESKSFLDHIGAALPYTALPAFDKLLLTDVRGGSYRFQLPLGGFGISRYMLDYKLFEIARQKGVTVVTNTKAEDVKHINNHMAIQVAGSLQACKVVAGCFGKRSNLDVKWRRNFIHQRPKAKNNYVGIKYHILYQHASNEIALHNFTDGYCGLSKIEDDKSCLCYLTTADNLKRAGNSVALLEQEVLYKNPHLKKIFTEAEFLYTTPLAISQINFGVKELVDNGVLFAGDAAGMISPLCGNGMSMALHASKIAFENISLFIDGQASRLQMEELYKEKWLKTFSTRMRMGKTIQYMFGNNHLTTIFLKSVSKSNILSRYLISHTHGKPF